MRFDIMPFGAPAGGTWKMEHVQVGALSTLATANTSWREGEVLLVNAAAGDVDVCANGARTITGNVFIAAASSEALINAAKATPGAASFRILAPLYPLQPDQEYITKFAVNGSAVQVAVSTLFVGQQGALWRDNTAVGTSSFGVNGRFSFDKNGTGLTITRILDAKKVDIAISGGTGVYLVFRAN